MQRGTHTRRDQPETKRAHAAGYTVSEKARMQRGTNTSRDQPEICKNKLLNFFFGPDQPEIETDKKKVEQFVLALSNNKLPLRRGGF